MKNSTNYLSPKAQSDLKQGLNIWARLNHIRPSDFARAMGYTPAYAWNLLRGKAPVTLPTIGLFLFCYGIQATGELLKVSGLSGDMVDASSNNPEKASDSHR